MSYLRPDFQPGRSRPRAPGPSLSSATWATSSATTSRAKPVAACEDELRKATRRYNDLIDEGQNLAQRKQKLAQDIAGNLDAQSKQARDVEKAKLKLEQIKAMKRG